MSDSRRDIDLESLSRPAASRDSVPAPRRRWLFWIAPIVLVAGFAFVLLDSARSLFETAVPVTIVRPHPAGDDAGAPTGAIVFQAAGWVEPDPYPVRVTALTDGVVERMLVEEADAVEAGQPVAELVAEDAKLAVAKAEAALGRAKAEQRLASVELENATAAFEAALEVTEARDGARATVEGRRAEWRRRQSAAAEAEAAVTVAQREVDTQRFLKDEDAVGPWQLELAEARLEEAKSRRSMLQADAERARASITEAEAALRRAEGDYELRLVEHLRVNRARAALPRAEADVRGAEARLAEAQLALSRMTVRSPQAGIVLTREAQPGAVVGPSASASAVCHLYDPQALRVRVDVPQNQVAGASVGQRAEIRSDARRGAVYRGEVIRIVETADIQKVTLEVQVRVLDPDRHLKPDMLCQVSVFRKASPSGDEGSRGAAVEIPARCLARPEAVWVVDATTGRAALRSVRVGTRRDEVVVIEEGLNLTDKVIDGNTALLEEGSKIHVEGNR